MEILSTETFATIASLFKVFFVVIGALVVITHFFYTKETAKMERKLQIFLPQSVRIAIALELVLAVSFLIISLVILAFL